MCGEGNLLWNNYKLIISCAAEETERDLHKIPVIPEAS